jgi:hypothetical protein
MDDLWMFSMVYGYNSWHIYILCILYIITIWWIMDYGIHIVHIIYIILYNGIYIMVMYYIFLHIQMFMGDHKMHISHYLPVYYHGLCPIHGHKNVQPCFWGQFRGDTMTRYASGIQTAILRVGKIHGSCQKGYARFRRFIMISSHNPSYRNNM